MPITVNDLTIRPSGIDMDTLLSEWTCAMPEPLRPVLLTAMGDMFAQGESGAVYFVDMVEGNIRVVADDGDSFQSLMRNSQFVSDHMFPSRIVQFRKAGMSLETAQVCSHKKLLVLSGDDDIGCRSDRRQRPRQYSRSSAPAGQRSARWHSNLRNQDQVTREGPNNTLRLGCCVASPLIDSLG